MRALIVLIRIKVEESMHYAYYIGSAVLSQAHAYTRASTTYSDVCTRYSTILVVNTKADESRFRVASVAAAISSLSHCCSLVARALVDSNSHPFTIVSPTTHLHIISENRFLLFATAQYTRLLFLATRHLALISSSRPTFARFFHGKRLFTRKYSNISERPSLPVFTRPFRLGRGALISIGTRARGRAPRTLYSTLAPGFARAQIDRWHEDPQPP